MVAIVVGGSSELLIVSSSDSMPPMKTAALIILILSLVACSGGESVESFRMPGGSQPGQFDRDVAMCNNQARIVAGANARVWFSDARRDCLIGRGWVPA